MCAYIIFINVKMSGAKVNNSNFQNARTNAPAITRRCVGSRQIVMVKSRYMRNSLRRMHACLVQQVPTRPHVVFVMEIGKPRVWSGSLDLGIVFKWEKKHLMRTCMANLRDFPEKNMHFFGPRAMPPTMYRCAFGAPRVGQQVTTKLTFELIVINGAPTNGRKYAGSLFFLPLQVELRLSDCYG